MHAQTLSSRYTDLICRAVRICNSANVMDQNGHVSGRDEHDPNVMWINNRHASRSTIRPSDVIAVDIATGRTIGAGEEPPSEWPIHTEIYKRRPDVHGIVHCHPRLILGLSATDTPLRPIASTGSFLPEAGAPVFDSAVLINTVQRGEALAAVLGEAPFVVMRQHGAVAVGDCVEQAVKRMIAAETNADLLCLALTIGKPRYLAGSELASLSGERGGAYGTRKHWHFLEETAAKVGAFEGMDD